MSLECKCDECNKYVNVDEYVCCSACYNKLMDEVKSLEARIDELEKKD